LPLGSHGLWQGSHGLWQGSDGFGHVFGHGSQQGSAQGSQQQPVKMIVVNPEVIMAPRNFILVSLK